MVGLGALADAGVQAAEAGGRMARTGHHANNDLFVNALVPLERNEIAQRHHQLEFEPHHVMQAGMPRGQDFVHDRGDVFGREFIGGQQFVHKGFMLAKPEVVGARGILCAAGSIAVDAEVRGVDQSRLEHRNLHIEQRAFLAQAFAEAHHGELA